MHACGHTMRTCSGYGLRVWQGILGSEWPAKPGWPGEQEGSNPTRPPQWVSASPVSVSVSSPTVECWSRTSISSVPVLPALGGYQTDGGGSKSSSSLHPGRCSHDPVSQSPFQKDRGWWPYQELDHTSLMEAGPSWVQHALQAPHCLVTSHAQ